MPRFNFPPLGFGLGLRTAHYQAILNQSPAVQWFEVLSDNYINTRGRPLEYLDQIAERYPVALHGVGLSVGSPAALDWDYVRALKQLAARTNAHWVSDHIAWGSIPGRFAHDLFPLPFTEEALMHTATRIKQIQDVLGMPLVLENPSTYAAFAGSTLTEWEFIAALASEADCGLLLDVNNLYVNGHNHGFNPRVALTHLPLDRVVQLHIAGHNQADAIWIDTHDGPVCDAVWDLLALARTLGANAPVLLEWDANIPDFDVVLAELERARSVWSSAAPRPATPRPSSESISAPSM
jgi:uncharacterized protein